MGLNDNVTKALVKDSEGMLKDKSVSEFNLNTTTSKESVLGSEVFSGKKTDTIICESQLAKFGNAQEHEPGTPFNPNINSGILKGAAQMLGQNNGQSR